MGNKVKDIFKRYNACRGFTLVEMLIVIIVIAILAAIAIPNYTGYMDSLNIGTAVTDIRECQVKILGFTAENSTLPATLNDVGCESQDPWGNPYQFADYDTIPSGDRRKDRNLNPINSDYDLYSMGKDGETHKQLNAPKGRDDIVRANDGLYVGLGENY